MSRVQLALNVSDIDAAVDYYSRLFATEPTKRQPGYANFAIAEPPLKLVLIENPSARGSGVTGALNHLGVEVSTPDEVQLAIKRFSGQGLETDVQDSTTCCYAVQDKVWTNDPDGVPWEYYTVLADASDEAGLGCSTEGCAPHVDEAAPIGVRAAAKTEACC
jgi:catechol 2,3-dioxygenase-like lactoylglutathione lyase family enzyme